MSAEPQETTKEVEPEAEAKQEPATEPAAAAAGNETETTAETTEGATGTEGQKTKSQLKKERKIAARKEYWKAERARKREHYREAKRQKKEAARARGEDMEAWVDKRRKKNSFWKAVDANGVAPLATVAVDLGFGDAMSEKERKSAVNQLGYCYAANGRDYSAVAGMDMPASSTSTSTSATGATTASSELPPPLCECASLPEVAPHVPHRCAACLPGYFELVMTGFAGAVRDAALRVDGSQHWRHVAWDARPYTEVFAAQQRAGRLVYLTSEAEDVLREIEPDTVYVIGGIVDHNRLKGLTHREATARGVRTARLPLAETVDMASRKVLTINHCYEVLLAYANIRALQQRRAAGAQPLSPMQCWARAVTAVLPARKGAHSKDEDDEDDESDEDDKGENNSEVPAPESEEKSTTNVPPPENASDAPSQEK